MVSRGRDVFKVDEVHNLGSKGRFGDLLEAFRQSTIIIGSIG